MATGWALGNIKIESIMKTKTVIFFFIFSIFFLQCHAQEKVKNDVQNLGIQGKVHSVKEIMYQALNKSGGIQKGKERENTFRTFNENLNINEEISYDSTETIWNRNIYKYDASGNLTEKTSFKRGGKLTSKSIINYDKNGNMIEQIWYDSDLKVSGSSTYKYDKSNKKILEKIFQPKNQLKSKTTFKYDTKGNKCEEIFYNAEGDTLSRNIFIYDLEILLSEIEYDASGAIFIRNTFQYDQVGNLIEIKGYNSNDKVVDHVLTKYDENNNVIESISYDTRVGWANYHKTYSYDYDEQHNWIKRISFQDEQPHTIWIREIKY